MIDVTRRFWLGAAAATAVSAPLNIPRQSVIPAALTPFDAELRIDRKQFRQHLQSLAAVPGVTAIMVNGASGQDAALSRDERRMLVAEAVAAVGDRTPIIAALRETRTMTLADLARDAMAERAYALMVMPPPDKGDLELKRARARFQPVFDAVVAPVAIYNTAYANETLAELAALPAIFAVKDGSGDPVSFERNLRAVRGLGRGTATWTTNSRWLLADLAVGADGVLSGMGSVAADLLATLADAVRRSDLAGARRINDRIFPLTQAFYRPGADPHTRMKYALKRLGQWESDHVRPPFSPVDAEERARIDAALQASGLLRA